MLRSRTILVVGCGACLAVGLSVATACITVPPPDLPLAPVHGPSILHESVVPPTDQILAELPTFEVPVQLDEANASFQWDVFVDYDPVSPGSTAPVILSEQNESPSDGGINLVEFTLQPGSAALDPSQCHQIQFLVAHQFNGSSLHTWDSVGGDIVSWTYNPGGGIAGCPVYDAGALQDGAFPKEASTDGLPVVPESGGDP